MALDGYKTEAMRERHMAKRLAMQKITVKTPPIPLFWSAAISASLEVGRYWFACAGRITKVFVRIGAEVKRENPAVLTFELGNGSTGHFATITLRAAEASAKVDISVAEGETLLIRINSEAFKNVDLAALFEPATDVLATAKAYYNELQRLEDEGNGNSIAGLSESGPQTEAQNQIEYSGTSDVSESSADGGGSGTSTGGVCDHGPTSGS